MRHVNRHQLGSLLLAFLFVSTAAVLCRLDAGEPDDNVIETFDVARNGDVLLLPVAIGGRQVQFVVDTGASFSIIDTALESELELLPGFAQINGNRREKRFHLRAAHVGKSRQLLTGKALCLDLSQFRQASGYDIRGLLGMTFLKAHVVHIDFDAGKLSILKHAHASLGSEFRVSYNNLQVPLLDVDFGDGDTAAFIIDTGMVADALKFRSYRIDELAESGRLELIGRPALTTTIEGDVRLRGGRLDHLRLGDFYHEGVSASEGEQNQIGLDLLSRYVVTFDFPNDRLYLKPGKRFAERGKFGIGGLAFGRVDGKTRIRSVGKNSEADTAGLKVGDELLRLDGKNASSLTLFQIHSVLTTEGRRVRLVVDSSAGRREIDIRVSGPVTD